MPDRSQKLGSAQDEAGRQDVIDACGPNPVQLIDEQVCSGSAHARDVLSDDGNRGVVKCCDVEVVEPDEGRAAAGIAECHQGADGGAVVGGEDRVRVCPGEQPGDRSGRLLVGMGVRADEFGPVPSPHRGALPRSPSRCSSV